MHVRITKPRLVAAGLFVLAGVGLSSLLSPLVGDALATVGSVVNISDHSSSAYFAKVDSSGALKTTAAVTGRVAPALPPQPFAVTHSIDEGPYVYPLGPTTATVALTDLRLDNDFLNQGRRLVVFEASAPAPNTACANTRSRLVDVYDVGTAGTVVANFETPIVLKPLVSGDAWCLGAQLIGPSDNNYFDEVSVGGYVLSGTFTPPPAPPPAKAWKAMREGLEPRGGTRQSP